MANPPSELEQLVVQAETSLRKDEQINIDLPAVAAITRNLPWSTESPLSLKRCGHRLWQVCVSAAVPKTPMLAGAAAASTRELACELIETGMLRTGGWPAHDKKDLVLQWGVTGKAWLDLEDYGGAVRCLTKSSAALDTFTGSGKGQDVSTNDVERLNEVALQTQLWAATAWSRLGRHDQAFVALSKASSIFKASPALAAASLGLFLHACHGQVVLLREAEKARLAADVLLLALVALPQDVDETKLQPERGELLRLLAVCLSDLKDHPAAVARAREAARLELPGSSPHAKCLRTLLSVLCVPGATEALEKKGQVNDAGEVALEFVTHRKARLSEALDACGDLADQGLDDACLGCLVRLRNRVRDDPAELGIAWLFTARLLARRVEESVGANQHNSSEVMVDKFCQLLDEIEIATVRPPDLAEKLAALLWGLASALFRRGHPKAAMVWLNRALTFLSEMGQSSGGWRALAMCHMAVGEADLGRRCAETALVHFAADTSAATLVLLDTVARGDGEAARAVLRRVESQEVKLTAAQVAYVVEEVGSQPPSDALLDCIEILRKCVAEDPEAAKSLGINPQWVLRRSLEVAEALEKPIERSVSYLEAVAELALPEAEASWFWHFAQRRGTALVDQHRFLEAVSLLERAHILLEVAGTGVVVERVWCAAAIIQALMQEAAGASEAADAQKLRQSAVSWAESSRDAIKPLVGAGTATAADRTLARMQFEALCLLGHGGIGDDLIEVAAPDARRASLLARLAMEACNIEVARRCLRLYLRLASHTDPNAGPKVAAARRELLSLCAEDDDEILLSCQEAVNLLREVGEDHALPACLPLKEALWLAVTAWNAGAELHRRQDCRGQPRMRAGLDLLGCLVRVESADELAKLHSRLSKTMLASPTLAAEEGENTNEM